MRSKAFNKRMKHIKKECLSNNTWYLNPQQIYWRLDCNLFVENPLQNSTWLMKCWMFTSTHYNLFRIKCTIIEWRRQFPVTSFSSLMWCCHLVVRNSSTIRSRIASHCERVHWLNWELLKLFFFIILFIFFFFFFFFFWSSNLHRQFLHVRRQKQSLLWAQLLLEWSCGWSGTRWPCW